MALTCRHCDAGLLDEARFCTNCGRPVARTTTPLRDPSPDEPAPRLVECDECGAGNATSRPICARCGTPLRDEIPGGDALPESAFEPAGAPAQPDTDRDTPGILLGLVILAGLVTAGVLLALVTSRVTTPDTTVVPAGVELQSASASSALEDHPASLATDGDPQTAWTESAQGPGLEEWIEVTMASDVAVRRVILWNGDQRNDERFAENGRASAVRIDVADRQFRVNLQEVMGPQAVALPEPVTADRLRIIVLEAIPGDRYADLAISEIVVEAGA